MNVDGITCTQRQAPALASRSILALPEVGLPGRGSVWCLQPPSFSSLTIRIRRRLRRHPGENGLLLATSASGKDPQQAAELPNYALSLASHCTRRQVATCMRLIRDADFDGHSLFNSLLNAVFYETQKRPLHSIILAFTQQTVAAQEGRHALVWSSRSSTTTMHYVNHHEGL